MDFMAAWTAIREGVDPIVVLSVVMLAIISRELRELVKLQATTNVKLDAIHNEIREHGAHQTSRMEEIRRFMLSLHRGLSRQSPKD